MVIIELAAVCMVMLVLLVSIARFAWLVEVSSEGVTIRTLFFGRKYIPWKNVRSPVRFSSIPGMTMFSFNFASAKRLSIQVPVTAWVPRAVGKLGLQACIPSNIEIKEWQ